MCNEKEEVLVLIPADLSHTGEKQWEYKPIDKCIHKIVEALQNNCINMRGSCCGHGKTDGEILLQDGRTIIIRRKNGNKIFKRFKRSIE